MIYIVTNPTDHKQSLNTIKESKFVNPRESIEINSEDFYESELKRAQKFLKFEPKAENKPTANVDKPTKKNDKEVV